jgi:hypothetical protein
LAVHLTLMSGSVVDIYASGFSRWVLL